MQLGEYWQLRTHKLPDLLEKWPGGVYEIPGRDLLRAIRGVDAHRFHSATLDINAGHAALKQLNATEASLLQQ
jgi:hypothetical protein